MAGRPLFTQSLANVGDMPDKTVVRPGADLSVDKSASVNSARYNFVFAIMSSKDTLPMMAMP